MGLSASQARLLSITARLTQNETRSQLITNAKLRLAGKSGEASQEYMDSLNATKFIYTNYDSTGTRKTQDFTFGAVTQFSEIKNQYGFIDSVGRILVSAEDAKNYENSGALADFLACYNIGDTNNPQRDIELDKIYGEEFGQWYDDGNPHNWLDQVTGATSGIIDDVVTNSTSVNPNFNYNIIEDEAAYEKWKQDLANAVDSIKNNDNKSDGLYNTWLDEIKDVPDYIEKPIAPNATPPTPPTPPDPDDFQVLDDFVQYVVDGQCYGYAEQGKNCYMHVLSDLLGPGEHITSSGQKFTVIQSSDWDWNTCHVGANGHTYGGQIDAVRDIINRTTCQDDPNKTIYQKIVDFLWDTHGDYDGSATGGDASQANLDKFFEIIHVDLAAAKDSTAWDEAVDDYNKKYQEYLEQLDIYNQKMQEYKDALKQWETEFIGQLETWNNNVNMAHNNYQEAIDNLPPATIPDEDDPKYQWYTNLWFRMGGISETKKEPDQNHYKILEDFYVDNDDWIKFALEHGIVTMEQVQYQEEGETIDEEMNQYAWVSIQHNNCADMYEETDELAISRAEAEYQRKTKEIQSKDKEYDTDLKKLDTEHNALQTEYDSIKSVIEKNTDRSFKAFS